MIKKSKIRNNMLCIIKESGNLLIQIDKHHWLYDLLRILWENMYSLIGQKILKKVEFVFLKNMWWWLHKLKIQKHFGPIVCVLFYLCIRKTAALVVDWQMCAKNQRELVCKCGGHSLKSTYHRLKSAFKLNKFLAMKFLNYFLSQIDITRGLVWYERPF